MQDADGENKFEVLVVEALNEMMEADDKRVEEVKGIVKFSSLRDAFKRAGIDARTFH